MDKLQTVEYTGEDDAKIAKELGWTFHKGILNKWWESPNKAMERYECPRFASAPTPDTEWEIRQWARNQDEVIQMKLFSQLEIIASERTKRWYPADWVLFYLRELGDWAQALLEVLKDE